MITACTITAEGYRLLICDTIVVVVVVVVNNEQKQYYSVYHTRGLIIVEPLAPGLCVSYGTTTHTGILG